VRHFGPSLRATLLYSLLTIAVTWPMASHLRRMDAGDSAFFAWEMGWELHAVTSAPRALPHANIFHPLRYALGLDEPILGTTVLMLPALLVTRDAVWLLNVARLLTYVLSALAAYRLGRELALGERASLVVGAAFAFSLVRCAQFGHLSTLGTQWLPWLLLFLCRFGRTGRMRDALATGIFYALEAYACGYHGLIAAALLPVAAVPLVWGRWRLVPRALPGAALAGVAVLPLYAMHHAALAGEGYVRSAGETVLYSASLETFLAAPWWSALYGGLTSPLRGAANPLFVGLVPVIAIGVAVARSARLRQPPRRETWVFIALALAAAAFALGPEVRLLGLRLGPGPYVWLRAALPVFANIRVASRAGAFLALAVAVLLGKAIARWEARPLLVAVVGLLAVGEGAMRPGAVLGGKPVIDTAQAPPGVYRWLAQQPGEFAVAELPMQTLGEGKPAFHESVYMVYSTLHWKRLLNGFAGIEPAQYAALRESLADFPAPEAVAALRARGARYVVLHRGGYGPHKWARMARELEGAPALFLALEQDGDSVYEIAPL
jgi:hypothetical protein